MTIEQLLIENQEILYRMKNEEWDTGKFIKELKGENNMKVKFTQEDLDAIEYAYFDNEGYMPCKVDHIPKLKEYQVLQQLWLRMADKINEKINPKPIDNKKKK